MLIRGLTLFRGESGWKGFEDDMGEEFFDEREERSDGMALSFAFKERNWLGDRVC